MVNHLLVGLHGLDVCGDAGGGSPLHTTLVHRVLAYWGRKASSSLLGSSLENGIGLLIPGKIEF